MAVLPSLHVGSATTLARHIGHVRSRSNQRDMQSSQNMCCLGRNKNWQIQIKRVDIKEQKLVWVGKLECISIEKNKPKLSHRQIRNRKNILGSQCKLKVKAANCLKRGKTRATASHLLLVVNLIG